MVTSAKKFFSANLSWAPRQEARFFSAIRLSNGTFKTTSDHRMDDLNAFIIAQWKHSNFWPTEILDLGASSGIASVEWIETLTKAGFGCHLTATDLLLRAKIVHLYPGFDVLEDWSGHILQHMVFGVGIRPWQRRLDYLTGYAFLSWLANLVAAHLRAKNRHLDASTAVLLVSPRARAHPNIAWGEDDVLAPNSEEFVRRFHAIRAANILNRGYFSASQLHRAVLNLKNRLIGPNSILIVNRTRNDGSNHATLFRLNDSDRFEMQAKFGTGSEIDDVVLGI